MITESDCPPRYVKSAYNSEDEEVKKIKINSIKKTQQKKWENLAKNLEKKICSHPTSMRSSLIELQEKFASKTIEKSKNEKREEEVIALA